jgi:glycosyltransferase involved in cell wall biosynthesis
MDGLARGMAEKHEVSLLSLRGGDEHAQASLAECKKYCREVFDYELDVLNPSGRIKRALQLRSLVSRHTFETLITVSRDFQSYFDNVIRDGDYDVVQVEFCQMGAYRLPAPAGGRRPRYVLDEHNIEYEILKRTAQASESKLRKLYNEVNWRKLRHEELECWRRFDGVALTSVRDEQILHEEMRGVRTRVVPNGVDVDGFRPTGAPAKPDEILFFGALSYYPNTDGLNHFIDETLPRIVAQRPNVKLRVVGPSPAASTLARASAHVEVVGFVDDLRPEIERASAVVVPLRIGGGTRLKIVEAMAMARPIVSTSLGAEGIDVKHEEHLLLADTPELFSKEVLRLLDDSALQARLGAAARGLAETRYSWRAAVGNLQEFYEELGARRSSSAA